MAEIITTEDGIEMSMILARNENADMMDLFSVMGCNLTSVCLQHEKENGNNEVIAKLNQDTLTAEGRKEWKDIQNPRGDMGMNLYKSLHHAIFCDKISHERFTIKQRRWIL